MSDDQKLPTILPNLLPHSEQATEPPYAEQGPPPADFASRPIPPTPAPSTEHLSAEQVAALVGQDESAVEANRELEESEGVDPNLSED